MPGLLSAGSSFDDAVRNVHEVLAYYAQTAKLPSPRTLEQIVQTWEDWSEWQANYHFIVTAIAVVPVTTRARRINIMMNEGLLAQLDTVTQNCSEFISHAVERALG
ncbi:hypothetical protein FACS1894141_1900 [Spirochaetia bacterium]|nr:hypothetical protein FACS1894141_1900 [Spirochaetia bacterium]